MIHQFFDVSSSRQVRLTIQTVGDSLRTAATPRKYMVFGTESRDAQVLILVFGHFDGGCFGKELLDAFRHFRFCKGLGFSGFPEVYPRCSRD